LIRLGVLAGVVLICCVWGFFVMKKMPGKSYRGPLPALTAEQAILRQELIGDVEVLAAQIGERNIWHYKNLTAAADFIQSSLEKAGYTVGRQDFEVEGEVCSNIEVEIGGTKQPEQIVIVGAHYDSVFGSPGANDNASAVATAMVLARRLAGKKLGCTLRFVFFVNEEPPFFQTERMGSLVYARRCKERNENIVAMLSLETIGYYSDQPNSQRYVFPFNLVYPSVGNFLAFISNVASRDLLHRTVASFRTNCKFPSQGGAIPEFVPGIAWSDQWSFWKQGYQAIMVTDTAPFRYPYYHSSDDTPDKLNYDHLARISTGLQLLITELVKSE